MATLRYIDGVDFTETSANLTPVVIRCEVRFEVAPLKE